MPAHDHSCDSSHGHHNHTPEVDAANSRAVCIAAIITGTFMAVEFVGGHISGSLALLADAGHMLNDFAALLVAWLAFHISHLNAHKDNSSTKKIPIYAALFNIITLFFIAIWIIWEAYERFNSPAPILGGLMFFIALIGFIINLVVLKILATADGNNLNIKAVNMHVMGDLLGSLAAIIASISIIFTDWTMIDPILSVVVALIIARGAWHVGKETLHELRH